MTERPPIPPDGSSDDHVDADTLADLREGLLDPVRSRAVEEHLARCSVCGADDRALAAIPGLLASAGDAGRMPDDVARRISDALSREAPVPVAAAATVTPLGTRPAGDQRVRGMRVLQAAAVLVVILLGVGVALSTGGGQDAADTSAGSAVDQQSEAEPKAVAGFPVTSSGRAWTKDSVAAAVPALVGGTLGPVAAEAPSSERGGDSAGGQSGGETTGGPNTLSRDADRLAGGPALTECVTGLNGSPVAPLSVDVGTWEGEPATVIVLPTEDDPTSVDVYVVRPGCPPGELLYFVRAARP